MTKTHSHQERRVRLSVEQPYLGKEIRQRENSAKTLSLLAGPDIDRVPSVRMASSNAHLLF